MLNAFFQESVTTIYIEIIIWKIIRIKVLIYYKCQDTWKIFRIKIDLELTIYIIKIL